MSNDFSSGTGNCHHLKPFGFIDNNYTNSVLFVDDEPLILKALKRDLSGQNIELWLTETGEQAIDLIGKKKFAVVVSDFRMPGMNGIDLLEEVRRRDPEAVRILVSGKADTKMAIQVINRVGLFNFISKPWKPNEIKDVLYRALQHHNITLENKKLNKLLAVKCSELGTLARDLEAQVDSRTSSLLIGLVNALDLRDTETTCHSRRVALYSRRLAEELSLSDAEILSIERGALLHDVGKIGVSDTILLKPEKLTEQEWMEMKKHAEYGYRLLEGIDFLGDARNVVWQHHERFDGKGYPIGLEGEEICLGARIFSIIDTFDAVTSDRPYRKALSYEKACKEIKNGIGSQYDPLIVAAWNRIPHIEIMALRERALDNI